jgi:hypothetical protein
MSSYVFFRQFKDDSSAPLTWHYKLGRSESAETIAIGSAYCAVYTSLGYLRIFSIEGVQKQVLHLGLSVVSMTAYESYLAIVYHAAAPFCN